MDCDVGRILNECCQGSSSSVNYAPTSEEMQILQHRLATDTVINSVCRAHKTQFLLRYSLHETSCCNPLDFHKQNKPAKKGLRTISLDFAKKHKKVGLIPGKKICGPCRNLLSKHVSSSSSSVDSSEEFKDVNAELDILNESMEVLGESPVKKRKLHQKHYPEEKLQKISDTIKKRLKMEKSKVTSSHQNRKERDYDMLIAKLKEKFASVEKRSEKVQVLTILAGSWSAARIIKEFDTTEYMAKTAKKLAKERGILSTPDPKVGHPVPQTTTTLIKEFYEDDVVSRVMPGKKDFVSVKIGDQKHHFQKRLILCTLNEAYQHFKSKHPEIKIGFTKFTTLRPKHVVLPGTSGTHNVCVCHIHQNVKLMIEGTKIGVPTVLRIEDFSEKCTYRHFLNFLRCNPSKPECYLNACDECQEKLKNLQDNLEDYLDENYIDNLTYKAWQTTDRTTLDTINKSADEFVETFLQKLQHLQRHDFIAVQQSMYLQSLKETLSFDSAIVLADFSENYSFVLQDAVQGFHWTNSQATIHPFVIYYRLQGSDILDHLNFVIISDCLKHDTTSVHCFQKYLVQFLESKISVLKLHYFTDGAASQYKNKKNFLNLAYHKKDFNMDAEWNFFATSHGKGPCDGLGGTVKRLAARASLQRPYSQQIQTPKQLFEFAVANIPKVSFAYIPEHIIEEERAMLSDRFEMAVAIVGTQKFHAYSPMPDSQMYVEVKEYSISETKEQKRVSSLACADDIPWKDVVGYVTVEYDSRWWLALVTYTNSQTNEINVKFLHPAGPSPSFAYPAIEDCLTITKATILTSVSPKTATGRVYTLTTKEQQQATDTLKLKAPK